MRTATFARLEPEIAEVAAIKIPLPSVVRTCYIPLAWLGGSSLMESYAALINRKLVLASQRTSFLAVEPFFFAQIHRDRVGRIYVDEDWYMSNHPDVSLAIASERLASAKEHYTYFGYYEHRMPYEILVDEDWYLANNEDVRRAVSSAVFPSGQSHFVELGYREGRHPYPNFSLRLGDT